MHTFLALVLIFDWVTVTDTVTVPEPLPPRLAFVPQGRPVAPTPEAIPHAERVVPSLRGAASWYDWRPGEGAAGPKLRTLLGRDWRGQTVVVCGDNDCIPVRLTDWCQCYRNEPRERVIDLDVRSFSRLAPASAGLVHVTIHTH